VTYDAELADRIRALMPDLGEKRMFGGLAFLAGGHLAVAASGQGGLMVRVDPTRTEALLAEPHTAPVVMRGRELSGWLRVSEAGVATDDDLAHWVVRGLSAANAR